MNLHAFYNRKYIGDILLIRLTHQRQVTRHECYDDLCVLYNNDKVVGYNLFQASHYVQGLVDGKIKMTSTFVDEFNKVLISHQQMIVESDCDDKFKVGKIIEIKQHPDSDHLHICQVDIGDSVLQIVCGAANVGLHQLVAVAAVDAVMPSGIVIRPSKLRGIQSQGMLCSASELALADSLQKRGILLLDEKEYKVGESFFK